MIEQIKKKSSKYPNLDWKHENNSIHVYSKNGFDVWAVDNAPDYTIYFSGWHEEITD